MNNCPGHCRMLGWGKGPRVTMLASVTPQLFRFHHPGDSPQQDHSRDASLDHQPSPHRLQRGQDHNQHRRDPRLLPPQPPSPPQIADSKAIGVQCRQPHWCHHSQTGQKAPGIPDMADNAGGLEPTWRLIYPSLKMRMQRRPAITCQS